jgi:hypothetical protein
MIVSYSGIKLEVTNIDHYSRRPVMSDDGVDYLFTEHTLVAKALVNSDQIAIALRKNESDTVGMSYVQNGVTALIAGPRIGLPAAVAKSAQSTPIITDRSIRHWLSVPRRRLIVSDENPKGETTLLMSPKPGFTVDAHNGPFCSVFDVMDVYGDARTFAVLFGVKTYVSECEENLGIAGAFLSNRFRQTHDHDEDGYTTVTTEGEARFRTDFVAGALNPDLLRPYLFLPIPNGYKRRFIHAEGLSDGSGLNYSFVDEQQKQQLVVGDEIGATRVTANYSQVMITNEDKLGTALEALNRATQSALNSKWLKDPPPMTPMAPKPILPKFGPAPAAPKPAPGPLLPKH